jgi:hypothetical protein
MPELTDLLITLRARAPWRTVASPLLKSLGFSVRRGYDDTITEILSDPDAESKREDLEEALLEHLVAGEKYLRVYEADASQRQTLIRWAGQRESSQSELAQSFLQPAGDAILAASEPHGPQFVTTYEADDVGLAVIFTASRSFDERVPLSQEVLREEVRAESFERIYGIRRQRLQTYDVLWIPYRQDYVCIATDSPERAPTDFGVLSGVAIQAMITRTIGARLAEQNLWPAIDGLYQTPDGQCVELGFMTDTESVKLHKSRKGNKCLRRDQYHVGGSLVVGDNLNPYRLAMRWKRRFADRLTASPEIQLPGTARAFFKPIPELGHAFLRSCISIGDMEFVLSKLAPHV